MTKPLIQVKESTRYPGLFVQKYSRKVFYDNLWHTDPKLLESRGHVVDKDGNTVIRPFTKIFNRFENGTDIDRDEWCIAVEKVNGFMAAVTWVESVRSVVVSTTGSLDSDFVDMAKEMIPESFMNYVRLKAKPVTYLFEIVHPNDPHIIKEDTGAYLLGFRVVEGDAPYTSDFLFESVLDSFGKTHGIKRPKWVEAQFSDIVKMAKGCKHEGFVVYGQESKTALKIKSPYYLVQKMIARRKDIMSLNKELIDEEYFDLVNHLTEMGDSFTLMNEQERLVHMREFLEKQ